MTTAGQAAVMVKADAFDIAVLPVEILRWQDAKELALRYP